MLLLLVMTASCGGNRAAVLAPDAGGAGGSTMEDAGAANDLAQVRGSDLAVSSPADLSSPAMDLATPPDMAGCGTFPGDPCCADPTQSACPGVPGSGITLVCMNHSEVEGVVDKRCMQYTSSACGSFTQTCCNQNGQPQSLGDYCTLGGGGQPIEYCLGGTCRS